MEILLTIKASKTSAMIWWINTASRVHPDMNSRSIIMISLGKGYIQSKSSKQNLNIWISI